MASGHQLAVISKTTASPLVTGAASNGSGKLLSSVPVAQGATPDTTNSETRNAYAFAALKADGTVAAWGDAANGGLISTATASQLTNVVQIFSNTFAFAALKGDGTVVTWGMPPTVVTAAAFPPS